MGWRSLNPLLGGASIRRLGDFPADAVFEGSQSPFRRGKYSEAFPDQDFPKIETFRLNPLLGGASIRSAR